MSNTACFFLGFGIGVICTGALLYIFLRYIAVLLDEGRAIDAKSRKQRPMTVQHSG